MAGKDIGRGKTSGTLRTTLAYVVMIGATIGLFWIIQAYGSALPAPAPSGSLFGEPGVVGKIEVLPHLLIAMVTVILVARALGAVFRYLQQPPVIGEVIAGILLGPSLLGRVAPSVSAYILPPSVAPFLSVLSQVGVILFMFIIGLELDTTLLRKRTHTTVAISHASIVAPFLLGSVLSLWLYPRLSSYDVPFTSFALFIGVSMSVTAFPVLARILTDRGIQRSRMGVIALTCAAVDDVTAWCLLAFVVSVVNARVGGAALTIALTFAYVIGMFLIVRPLLSRLVRAEEARERVSQRASALVFVGLLFSALATELIGIHALFGAFLLGAIIPHDSKLAKDICSKLEDFVIIMFLPAFFAFTGMRTQIGLLGGADQWLICLLIIAVASLGKFGGSAVAARLTGLSWRDAASLGILMNTRGLMELIVLNIGLDLRVISPTLFAMLVVMAVVTTIATTPVLHLLTRRHSPADEPAEHTDHAESIG